MRSVELPGALRRLRKAVKAWRTPVVTEISRRRDPFRVLASCLLSLRTRDEITEAASERLFALAETPGKLLHCDLRLVEKAIYPVAFYRNKTRVLFDVCRNLIDHHQGKVPDTLETLLKLKGLAGKPPTSPLSSVMAGRVSALIPTCIAFPTVGVM